MTTRKVSFVLSAYTANKRKQERPSNGQGPRSKTVDVIIIALWRGTIIYWSKRREEAETTNRMVPAYDYLVQTASEERK